MSTPQVLRQIRVLGYGAQAPGSYVLRDFGPGAGHRYVVHFYNCQTGGFSDGSYCSSLEEAEKRLAERSSWVLAYHSRLAQLGIFADAADRSL